MKAEKHQKKPLNSGLSYQIKQNSRELFQEYYYRFFQLLSENRLQM